jgi:hypothetical protein
MKILLTILCVGMLLFSGGCAVLAGLSGVSGLAGLALIPVAVFVLNVIVLVALYSGPATLKIPLRILGVVDFLVAIGFLFGMAFVARDVGPMAGFGLLIAFAFAAKGALTFWLIKQG